MGGVGARLLQKEGNPLGHMLVEKPLAFGRGGGVILEQGQIEVKLVGQKVVRILLLVGHAQAQRMQERAHAQGAVPHQKLICFKIDGGIGGRGNRAGADEEAVELVF